MFCLKIFYIIFIMDICFKIGVIKDFKFFLLKLYLFFLDFFHPIGTSIVRIKHSCI